MPDKPASLSGPLTYNVDLGGRIVNLFDGLSAEEIERMTEGKEPPEEKKEDVPKAEEPEPEKPPEQAEPKKEEPTKPPEEKPAEPEAPKVPEKLKFKTKLRGVEEEREYTIEQLQTNLNRLRMFDENQQEFWRDKQKVEPFAKIIETEWFQRVLKEGQESGEITPPPEPPPVPPTVKFEMLKRQADPDYNEVVAEMRDYARTLPLEAAELLNSDPTVFLPEYDRIAKIRKERTAPPTPPKVDPKLQEKILQTKEKAKEAAVVEKPGTAPAADVRAAEMKKRERELIKKSRAGDMDATVELAMKYVAPRGNR